MLGKRPRVMPCFLSASQHRHVPEMHRLCGSSPSPASVPRHIVVGFELYPDSDTSPAPPPPEIGSNSKLLLDCCESPRSVLDSICSTPKQCVTRSPLFSLLYGKKDSLGVGLGIVDCGIHRAQEEDEDASEESNGTSVSNCNPSRSVFQETMECTPSSAQRPPLDGSHQIGSEPVDAAEKNKKEGIVALHRGSSSLFAASSPPPCSSFEKPSMLFLSEYCCFCRSLLHGKDIFMYRGDQAFCSMECRSQQISIDEGASGKN